ncbi:hypothetical protein TIFTF001_050807 [Ficus carica]|uniref:Uncharacterized protein n=1 Tax=Ficus carica TaxID=3494 RepID=A0AA88CJF4_FICCA|nr:hypothetical protein TIFTF001_050807 [Ficus carica]
MMTRHADAKSSARKQSDLQCYGRSPCFGNVKLGNEGVKRRRFSNMVAGEVVEVGGGIGLDDCERNGVAGDVENDGYGGIRRPSEVSGGGRRWRRKKRRSTGGNLNHKVSQKVNGIEKSGRESDESVEGKTRVFSSLVAMVSLEYESERMYK